MQHTFTPPGTITGFHGTTDFSPRVTKVSPEASAMTGNTDEIGHFNEGYDPADYATVTK